MAIDESNYRPKTSGTKRPKDLSMKMSFSQLSAEKQELFARLLAESGIESTTQTISRRNAVTAPLSYGQERMWFLYQFQSDKALYNLPLALRMRGKLDIASLKRAFDEIVRRHEALRTTFTDDEGRLMQVIQPAQTLDVRVIDLPEGLTDRKEDGVKRFIREEAQEPFDLTRSPLIRAMLLRLGPEEHILVVTMHHIASDGWSIELLRQELATLYSAFREGRNPQLPELSIQYADYAMWQREYSQGRELQAKLEYWKKQLAGMAGVLELPAKRPRPAVPDYRSAQHNFQITPPLLRSLEELSRAHRVTLFMVLLAAFQVLLSRHSGQADIAVGTPVSGRDESAVEGLIGFFVNTLVLRTDLSGNPTFLSLLERVRDVALGAYSNQDLPFQTLVEVLEPERDLSRSPLFQVLFINSAPAKPWTLPDMDVEELEVEYGKAPFDLTVGLKSNGRQIQGEILYRTSLFDTEMVTRLAAHYVTLLASIVDNPETPVLLLSLLTEQERREMLLEWGQGTQCLQKDKCVHQLFEEQVKRVPLKIAVVDQHESVTYQDLDRRANQLAYYLRRLGVGPDKLAAICVEPGASMVVGLLGILKAGGAYVPLDPDWPSERLGYVLEDSRASVLVTQDALLRRLPVFAGTIVRLDGHREEISREDFKSPGNCAGKANRAYVIYTSGSTGKPKGVEVPHSALSNFLASMLQEPGIHQDDLLLAVTTLSFDIAGLELYLPLIAGARVRVPSRDICFDGSRLLETLNEGVTVMQATPATWKSLLNAGWAGHSQLKALCGGEALSADLAKKLLERSRLAWNMYGPTETTIWSLTQKLGNVTDCVPIGRPIANTEVYVLNQEMEPAPAGVVGELYIGGAGLARGYLNRPALTADKFVPNPFSKTEGERLYRTGDQVRWINNGIIEFVGRSDDQVKVRGYRIELGEIESVLREHEAIGEAVVVVREDQPGDQRLVAYITKKNNYDFDSGELRGFLKQKLPSYMLPSCFVQLEKLLLTANGKIDRRSLPVPGLDAEERTAKYVAPATETEKKLAEIWSEVLGLEAVSAEDSFLDLGGHSLLAMQVTSRIRRMFGVELPLLTFFEQPTLSTIALLIDNGKIAGKKQRSRSRSKKRNLQPTE